MQARQKAPTTLKLHVKYFAEFLYSKKKNKKQNNILWHRNSKFKFTLSPKPLETSGIPTYTVSYSLPAAEPPL